MPKIFGDIPMTRNHITFYKEDWNKLHHLASITNVGPSVIVRELIASFLSSPKEEVLEALDVILKDVNCCPYDSNQRNRGKITAHGF